MATNPVAKQPDKKGAYTRRIIRESIAEHLNALSKKGKLDDIPEVHDFLPPGLGENLDLKEDNLPHRPQNQSRPPPTDAKVCIVGAGMAGLYCALILDHLSIPYDILEASDRPGGRILTHYFSPKKHDYYDIGAMRFPNVPPMARTFDLFERTKVPLRDYYLDGPGCPKRFNAITVIPGAPGHQENDPDPFKVSESNGGSVPDEMMPKVGKILEEAFEPFREAIKSDDPGAFEKLKNVDDLTVRDYLRDVMKIDFHTIQWLEETDSATGLFDQAFTESVLDSIAFDYGPEEEDWKCIEGGSSVLTDKFVELLKRRPMYNKRVTRIALDRSWTQDENKMVVVCNYDEGPRRYTSVINTTTLACLQRVDTTDLELPTTTRDAFRTLHYDSSTKVAIKFDHPWWATECGITKGGVSNTDLPIRVCVYPSYNVDDPKDQNAVLLATYTWAQDATRIGSLVNLDSPRGEAELKGLMLYNLARLHTTDSASFDRLYKIIKDSYITHHGFDWAMDDYTSGAFALFGPGQFRYLYPHLIRPCADARFLIVGEAASANHAWVVGSLESAYRGVWLFLERFRCFGLQKKMESEFGTIPELDGGEEGFAHLLIALGMIPQQFRNQVFANRSRGPKATSTG